MEVRADDGRELQRRSERALIEEFANTLDVDVDADPAEALPDAASLTRWLLDHGLVDDGILADAGDLQLAHTLRQGLREVLRRHIDPDRSSSIRELAIATRELPVTIDFEGQQPRLIPVHVDARGGLARILIAVINAQTEGAWSRFKLCAADECALAFFDESKNRSRRWCSMGMCGNRQKTRRYRARHRP